MSRIRDDFDAVQPQAISSLYREDGGKLIGVQSAQSVLNEIKNFDLGILRTLVGDAGSKLISFARVVDGDHPDLYQCLPSTACKSISEWLKLCEFTYNNNMSVVLPHIRALATREINNLKNIDDPAKTNRLVRLVKEKSERDKIRKNKSVRKIEMIAAYQTAIWDNLPDSFNAYVRFGEGFKTEIEKAERRLQRYKVLGTKALQEQIEIALTAFKAKVQEEFIGFRKLSITDTALLLAKMHGYNYVRAVRSGVETTCKITVPRGIFGFNFDEVKNASIYDATPRKAEYEFTPRAYNFFDLAAFASRETVKTIERLDSMPEVGGRPVFDHYVVVVPSIDFPIALSLRYEYMTPDGEKRTYRESAAAHKNFDIELIRNKFVTPVILGERDDKCYFISYFE